MEESDSQMRTWIDQDLISLRFDETEGIENAPTAYKCLFEGKNIGKSIIKI